MQTSMNLTDGLPGPVEPGAGDLTPRLYDEFLRDLPRDPRTGRPPVGPYRRYTSGNVTNIFFPRPATAAARPGDAGAEPDACTGSTAGGNGSTHQDPDHQYAIYDTRGVWIAKKLRSLWNAGCDIMIIYSVTSRPVMAILRNGSGRGAIPMRQSVITNGKREIVKYNHSKWMTIAGQLGRLDRFVRDLLRLGQLEHLAFSSDEQMQQISAVHHRRAHMLNFNMTWAQKTSHAPGFGIKGSEGRVLPPGNSNTIPWGKGIFKYLNPEG